MIDREKYRVLFSQKVSKKVRMFPFISDTCNPIGGYCYNCDYCYIHGKRGLKTRYPNLREKYTGEHKLYESVLSKRFKKGKFVFPCDCIDIFHPDIPRYMVRRVFEWISGNDAMFLILTKNPKGFLQYKLELPDNIAIGITCETNRDYRIDKIPNPYNRFKIFKQMIFSGEYDHYPRLISAEPIKRFDMITFYNQIKFCSPDCVAIGYDSHLSKLYEPYKSETLELIRRLRDSGVLVVKKIIREKWDYDNKQLQMRGF